MNKPPSLFALFPKRNPSPSATPLPHDPNLGSENPNDGEPGPSVADLLYLILQELRHNRGETVPSDLMDHRMIHPPSAAAGMERFEIRRPVSFLYVPPTRNRTYSLRINDVPIALTVPITVPVSVEWPRIETVQIDFAAGAVGDIIDVFLSSRPLRVNVGVI
jgi:hypothetical protein